MSDDARPKPGAASRPGDVVTRGAALAPGAVIAGRYRLERLLGEGGMAKVYEATDLAQRVPVALKVLRADLSSSKEAVARLRREGEVLTKLRHPAIVQVHTFGATDEGHLFLVMERLHGETLRSQMGAGPLAMGFLIPIVEAVSAALTTAHRAGVVHRDLKPENIFLGSYDAENLDAEPLATGAMEVKLLDFGVSKVVDKERLTQTGQVLGTPRYMAPEQLMAERNIDGRTDQYALGVILYEALSGTPPFVGRHPAELIVSILSGDAVPLAARRPDLPAALCACVDRAMSSEPRARFEDMSAFVTAFRTATNYRGPMQPAIARVAQKTTPMGAMTLPSEGGSGPKAALEAMPEEAAYTPRGGASVASASERPFPVTRVSERPDADLVAAQASAPRSGDASAPPVGRRWAKTSPSRAVASASTPQSPTSSARYDTPLGESWLPMKRRPWLMVSVGLLAGAVSAGLAIGLLRSCGTDDTGGVHGPPTEAPASEVHGDATVPVDNDADAHGSEPPTLTTAATSAAPVSPQAEEGAPSPPDAHAARPARRTRRQDRSARGQTTRSSTTSSDPAPGASSPFEQSILALKEARRARASGDLVACVTLSEKTLALGGPPIALRLRGDCQRLSGETDAARVSYERFCRVVGASHPAIGEVRALVQALGGSCP